MKSNTGQQIVTCKNCGSNKVKVSTPGANGCAMFFLGLIIASFGIWIPFVGWFFMIPLGIILMLCSILVPLLQKKYGVTCQDCTHKFDITKEEYTRYKKEIE